MTGHSSVSFLLAAIRHLSKIWRGRSLNLLYRLFAIIRSLFLRATRPLRLCVLNKVTSFVHGRLAPSGSQAPKSPQEQDNDLNEITDIPSSLVNLGFTERTTTICASRLPSHFPNDLEMLDISASTLR